MPRTDKRERLVAAATRVLHEQGVEKTTLADIAHAADVPVGNVYYYFKTKDQLVEAAIAEQLRGLRAWTGELDRLPDPAARLKALLRGWAEQRDLTAAHGCPTGSLASELNKRGDGLDRSAATAIRALVDWVAAQFRAIGHADAEERALALVASYQGVSLLANTFHDPRLVAVQMDRLARSVDEPPAVTNP